MTMTKKDSTLCVSGSDGPVESIQTERDTFFHCSIVFSSVETKGQEIERETHTHTHTAADVGPEAIIEKYPELKHHLNQNY